MSSTKRKLFSQIGIKFKHFQGFQACLTLWGSAGRWATFQDLDLRKLKSEVCRNNSWLGAIKFENIIKILNIYRVKWRTHVFVRAVWREHGLLGVVEAGVVRVVALYPSLHKLLPVSTKHTSCHLRDKDRCRMIGCFSSHLQRFTKAEIHDQKSILRCSA